ncbi:hypothetical protein SteCoe_28513 [Stentor coeruleus]|uniref:Uncharacterized protein n=1 Tax=Stentor coeruleus TaxID=5963 RepID=A0A1R2B827_9CILI|nr:hypothetical protein SteCoe_28513 [Stentor coeruleus]
MSRRAFEKKSEMWDLLRQNETPPPVVHTERAGFLPNISRGSQERLEKRHTPKMLPKLDDIPSIEIRGRLRDLEIQMLDLRSSTERRVSNISDDFPKKINKEIKTIQERENFMWKENSQKQQQLFDNMRFLQETMKTSFEQVSLEVSNLHRKFEDLAIKQSMTCKDIEYISKMPRAIEAPVQQPDFTSVFINFNEAMSEERRKREIQQQDFNRQIQELHSLLRNTYMEHGQKLQEYREQAIITQHETKGHLLGIEMTKEERQRNEQEYMKNVFTNLQKRLEDEVLQRTLLEKDYKLWMDNKMSTFHTLIRKDEKDLADRESKILGMMQEGLSALHEIIIRVGESGSASVDKVQSSANENFRDLAQALSSIKDNLYRRLENMEFIMESKGINIGEQGGSIGQYMKNLTEKVDSYKIALEDEIMSSENRLRAIIYEIQQNEVKRAEEFKKWEKNIKEHFEEEMRQNKENIDKTTKEIEKKTIDSREKTVKKVEKVKKNLETSVEQLKNGINYDEQMIENKISIGFNKIDEKLAGEINKLNTVLDKTLADFHIQSATNLAAKLENILKLAQDSLKKEISEESQARKMDIQNLQGQIKSSNDGVYLKIKKDFAKEIEVLAGKNGEMHIEEGFFNEELEKIKAESSNSIEQLLAFINEAKENIKLWSESYVGKVIIETKEQIENCKQEFYRNIDIPNNEHKVSTPRREFLPLNDDSQENLYIEKNENYESSKDPELKIPKDPEMKTDKNLDINIAKNPEVQIENDSELKTPKNLEINLIENPEVQIAKDNEINISKNNEINIPENPEMHIIENSEINISKDNETQIDKDNDKLKLIEKKFEEILLITQDTINQNSESMKKSCTELISKELSEFSQSQENIIKSLEEKISTLESQIITCQSAPELIKTELLSIIETEKSSRKDTEKTQNQYNKDIELQISTYKDKIEIELCVEMLIQSVTQSNFQTKLHQQKLELEQTIKRWVESFEKDFEDISSSISKEICKLRNGLTDDFNTKIIVKTLVDSMIGTLEADLANLGIEESQKNIEVLYRNMQKLEEFININKDELEKLLIEAVEKTKQEIVKELCDLANKESEFYEENKEKICALERKFLEWEKAKDMNLEVDDVEVIKMDLSKKEDTLNKLILRQDKLSKQQIDFIKKKNEEDEDLKNKIKEIIDENTIFEQKLTQIDEIINQAKFIDEHVKDISELKEKIKILDEQILHISKPH